MNKPTLANLYRQATRDAAGSALPDVDTLVALAHGERPVDAERIVAEVAQSALQSDLLHFTRALEPASSALSAELAATFGEDRVRIAHTRTQGTPARAAGRWRNLRRAGLSFAAAMIAAVAVWTQQHHAVVAPAPVAGVVAEDRIFAALNERSIANAHSDEIFNGSFKGDVIFQATGG
jgi:hypothetical protein